MEDESDMTTAMKAFMKSMEKTNALLEKTLVSRAQPGMEVGADEGVSLEDVVMAAREGRQTKVTLRVEFLKIENVDTKKNEYTGDLLLEARWKEPGLSGKTDDELDDIEVRYDEIWDPKLVILNMDQAPRTSDVWYDIEPGSDGIPVVIYRRKIRGSFFERLELRHFPFDVQELSLSIISEHPAKKVTLELNQDNPSCVHVYSFRDVDEWTLFKTINEKVEKHATDYSQKPEQTAGDGSVSMMDTRVTKIRKNKVVSSCYVARNYGYWLFNVFTILLLINCLTFTPFAFLPTQTSSRLGVMMSLLITCVAKKMAIGTMLPPISYLTYLDIYVLSVMGFLGLQATQFAVSSIWVKKKDLELIEGIDHYTMIGMGILLVSFNIGYIIFVFCTALAKRRRLGIAESKGLRSNRPKKSNKKNDDTNGEREKLNPCEV